MSKTNFNSLAKSTSVSNDFSILLDIILRISDRINTSKSEEEIFATLIGVLVEELQFVDCSIYKVDKEKERFVNVASFPKNDKTSIPNVITGFSSGHLGEAFTLKEGINIPDVSKSAQYLRANNTQGGSEIVVPLFIEGEVYALVSSEHPQKAYYEKIHIKLLQTIFSIISGAITRLKKEQYLEGYQSKLQQLLENQGKNLGESVEKVSLQNTELEKYYQKQEILMQEVHHRVTNNLQIISSILRLYKNEGSIQNNKPLEEIQGKVEAMALIYQNIYKSFETDHINVKSYIKDLTNHLAYSHEAIKINFKTEINFEYLDMELLVPIGLLITEVFYLWMNCGLVHKVSNIFIVLQFEMDKSTHQFTFRLKDDLKYRALEIDGLHSGTSGMVNKILISALIEQIDAVYEIDFFDGNCLTLSFQDKNIKRGEFE